MYITKWVRLRRAAVQGRSVFLGSRFAGLRREWPTHASGVRGRLRSYAGANQGVRPGGPWRGVAASTPTVLLPLLRVLLYLSSKQQWKRQRIVAVSTDDTASQKDEMPPANASDTPAVGAEQVQFVLLRVSRAFIVDQDPCLPLSVVDLIELGCVAGTRLCQRLWYLAAVAAQKATEPNARKEPCSLTVKQLRYAFVLGTRPSRASKLRYDALSPCPTLFTLYFALRTVRVGTNNHTPRSPAGFQLTSARPGLSRTPNTTARPLRRPRRTGLKNGFRSANPLLLPTREATLLLPCS